MAEVLFNINELAEWVEKRAAAMLAKDLRTMHESNYWHNYMKEVPPEDGEYLTAYHPVGHHTGYDVGGPFDKEKIYRDEMLVGIDWYRGGKPRPGDRKKWAKNKYRETVFWMEKPNAPFKEMWPKEPESEGEGK